jgi:hypothetical protein
MSPQEIANLTVFQTGRNRLAGSNFYEKVLDHLPPEPFATYKPLPSGRLMRTRGPNLLAKED